MAEESGDGLLGDGGSNEGEPLLTPPAEDNQSAGGASGDGTGGTKRDVYGYEKMFSKEYQGHSAFDGLDEPNKLAKSYVELKSKIGKSLIAPGADASEDDRYEFLKKAGFDTRPSSQDEYVFDNPEGVPEEDLSWFREAAFKLGLPQKSANELQATFRKAQYDALKGHVDKAAAEMRSENQMLGVKWGSESPRKAELANRTLAKFLKGDEKLIGFFKEIKWKGLPATQHPALREFFANIGEDLAESSLPMGDVLPSSGKKGGRFPGLDKI